VPDKSEPATFSHVRLLLLGQHSLPIFARFDATDLVHSSHQLDRCRSPITDLQPFSRRIGPAMANPAAARPDGILIADQYVVETGRKLVPVGGLASFAVTDRVSGRRDLMAIQLDRHLPPRPRAFHVLATPIE
jgi:hypothetical protein